MKYRVVVGCISILAGVLAAACMYTGADAVNYDFEAFANPVLTLTYAANHQQAERFLLLDMFGYYLLLLPLIFYLHQQYKFQSSWTPLITFSGLAYVLIGSIGAAILTALWPELMKDYLAADESNKQFVAGLFKTSTLLVTEGLWNILEVLFASVWWMGTAALLNRENKWLGALTLTAGLATLADAIGNIVGLKSLAEAGLNLYLVLGIAWPLLMGIAIIRKTRPGYPIVNAA
jgi:hypothetical protein